MRLSSIHKDQEAIALDEPEEVPHHGIISMGAWGSVVDVIFDPRSRLLKAVKVINGLNVVEWSVQFCPNAEESEHSFGDEFSNLEEWVADILAKHRGRDDLGLVQVARLVPLDFGKIRVLAWKRAEELISAQRGPDQNESTDDIERAWFSNWGK